MKMEIALSVAITAFLGTVLVWLSIILVDIDHWYLSAVDLGSAPGYSQVNPGTRTPITIPGGAL